MRKTILKKLLNILGWTSVTVSIILLFFGFGESGFQILKVSEFWVIVNSLWVLAILIFTIEGRF